MLAADGYYSGQSGLFYHIALYDSYRYLAEADYRYDNRQAEDGEQFALMSGID